MGSQSPPTRIQSAPPAPSPPRDGLDVLTLFLSAIASAASAYVTSKVWAPGALGAAAMSPVIVALVKETLRKPADLVTSAVPSPRALAVRRPRVAPLPADLTEQLDAGAPPPFPPPMAEAPEGPVRIYSTRARRLRWRLALVTGLLGFVICVAAYTVPEVIAGRSVVSSGHKTTFWGGHRHTGGSSTTTTQTTTAPATTAPTAGQGTQTVTAPAQTVTVAPPTATQPAPTTTTPPPAGATTTPTPAGGSGGQAAPSG